MKFIKLKDSAPSVGVDVITENHRVSLVRGEKTLVPDEVAEAAVKHHKYGEYIEEFKPRPSPKSRKT